MGVWVGLPWVFKGKCEKGGNIQTDGGEVCIEKNEGGWVMCGRERWNRKEGRKVWILYGSEGQKR